METKLFGDKKITIRKPAKSDARNLKKFQVFINSLVKEEAMILMNEKATPKQEKEYVNSMLKSVRNKSRVYLMAEHDNKLVGNASVELEKWRTNHIGKFAIAIADGYRGAGLGNYLMSEVIKLAKKELSPKPKIIQLRVYSNNTPTIGLYKKMGFKIVAKLPKQIQWKGKLIDEFIMLKFL